MRTLTNFSSVPFRRRRLDAAAARARCTRRRRHPRLGRGRDRGGRRQDRLGRRMRSRCPAEFAALPRFDGGGAALVTPGLVDCHTHLVYGGQRASEFEMRLAGASYEEVAKAGGGIVSSVRATREAERRRTAARRPRCALERAAGRRRHAPSRSSRATASRSTHERRQLRVARRLGEAYGVARAHHLPRRPCGAARVRGPRRRLHRPASATRCCPRSPPRGLVDAVDVFCERIAFSLAETERVFQAAKALGLPVKLHAEQLSDMGGAALAARYGALSCRPPRVPVGTKASPPCARAGTRGRAAARRLLHAARRPPAAGRGAARGRRADGRVHRPQPRHLAGAEPAADGQHGLHAVPPRRCPRRWPASPAMGRARWACSTRTARCTWASRPTSCCGTCGTQPSSPTGSASGRCAAVVRQGRVAVGAGRNDAHAVRGRCAAADRMGEERAAVMGRGRPAHAGAVRCAAGRPAHHACERPRDPRHAEPAFARLPARLRGPHRAPRRAAGQLLELAHAHVPLCRAPRAAAHGSHRHLALCRDARSAATPACASSSTCTRRHGRRPYAEWREPEPCALLRAAQRTGIGFTLLPGCSTSPAASAACPTRQASAAHPLDRVDAAPARRAEAGLRCAGRGRPGAASCCARCRPMPRVMRSPASMRWMPARRSTSTRGAGRRRSTARAWSGLRPVAWLLDHAPVDARWCLVHATHMDAQEYRARHARRGRRPSSDDRGQPRRRHLRLRGLARPWRGLGRGLGQPCLRQRGRRAAAARVQPAPGHARSAMSAPMRRTRRSRPRSTLAALHGGAQAAGRAVCGLAPGQQADFVVLDAAHTRTAGLDAPDMLSAHVFASHRTVGDRCGVGGRPAARRRPADMHCTTMPRPVSSPRAPTASEGLRPMRFITTEPPFRFRAGKRPLLISMPHVGTHVPPAARGAPHRRGPPGARHRLASRTPL